MERLVKEYADYLLSDLPASVKFWELEKRIKRDRKTPGVLINLDKSEMYWDIARLLHDKVITADDRKIAVGEIRNRKRQEKRPAWSGKTVRGVFAVLFGGIKEKGRKDSVKKYGYVRVSSKDQNPERQMAAMKRERIAEENIFMDKVSGKDFSRPEYGRLLKRLKKSDVIVVKSIDRLGRNYGEILEEWRKITKEIGADIRVLDMPLLNTNVVHSDLTGVFIADLVLQILAYVAETEREFIRQRQAEGIAAARGRGVCFGCPRVELPEQFDEYCAAWERGEISVRRAAELLGLSPSTFYRRCVERKNKNT